MGFFNILFEKLTLKEKAILEEKIIECYENKGITFDDNSLYEKNEISIKAKFKSSKQMPILEDLYNVLKKDKMSENMAIKLKPLINGSLKFLNNYTNINLNNSLIVIDIYDLKKENVLIGMYAMLEVILSEIKKDRSKEKIIYMDEVWKLIGNFSNSILAEFVQNIFKTIRKYKGSAVAITQDVSDLFDLEQGKYGKSLITNSSIKIAFQLEEQNIEVLNKYITLSDNEKLKIKCLDKGEAWIVAQNSRAIIKIRGSDEEHNAVET